MKKNNIKKYLQFIKENVNEMFLPDSVLEINEIFKKNGKKLFVVGGAVRDFLNGEVPKDIDLTTDAKPDETIEMLSKAGFRKINLQGKAFGVVVVYTKDSPEGIEIATFREDIGTGRRSSVRVGATIEEDTKRRDLTINAMFYDIDKKEVVDLVGGAEDLKNKTIRMVGDATQRIFEDPLRILRVWRFAARYGSHLDQSTIDAIHKNNKLKDVSMERIWDSDNGEIFKAFKQSKDFNQYLSFITEFDMWDQILPGVKKVNTDLVESKNFSIILANLLKYENPKSIEHHLVHNIKLDSNTAGRVFFLLDFKNLTYDNVLEMYKKKERYGVYNSTLEEWIKVSDLGDPIYSKFLEYEPSVSAQDLMSQGLKGKELGDTIKSMEADIFRIL